MNHASAAVGVFTSLRSLLPLPPRVPVGARRAAAGAAVLAASLLGGVRVLSHFAGRAASTKR